MVLGAAGAPEADVHAGEGLELEDDVLDDVAHVGAEAQALQEAARVPFGAAVLPEGGDGLDEALGEAGQFVRGEFFVLADVGEDFEHGAVGPDVGAARCLICGSSS